MRVSLFLSKMVNDKEGNKAVCKTTPAMQGLACMAGHSSSVVFGWSWTEVRDLGSQVFGQA